MRALLAQKGEPANLRSSSLIGSAPISEDKRPTNLPASRPRPDPARGAPAPPNAPYSDPARVMPGMEPERRRGFAASGLLDQPLLRPFKRFLACVDLINLSIL